MESSIKFSIIVPAYGVEKYIREALNCLRSQTYDNFEAIIVDDCSPDGSGVIAQEFAALDSRFTYIRHQVNQGVSAARNTGIEAAKGDYLLFLDPDDTYETSLLETCARALDREPVDYLVYSFMEDYRSAEDGQVTYSRPIGLKDLGIEGDSYTTKDVNHIHSMAMKLEHATMLGYPWNKCFKASIVKDSGLAYKKIKHVEDILFNCDMLDVISSMTILGDGLYHYRNQGQVRLTSGQIDDYFSLQSTRVQRLLDQQKAWGSLDVYGQSVLAGVYFRSFQSNMVRLMAAGYKRKDVLDWCKKESRSKLYLELKDHLPTDSRMVKLLYQPLAQGNFSLGLKRTRLIAFVKKNFSGLFNKLKQMR